MRSWKASITDPSRQPTTLLPSGHTLVMRTQEPPVRPEDSSAYLARRRRNNEAARRCRERRRMEELLLEVRALELLHENQRLRAALSALYPGPRLTDWPLICPEKRFPGTPYRAWTAPPVCQPPATSAQSLPGHLLHSELVMPPPSQTVESPSGPGAAAPDSSDRTPCNLPHKLRLKCSRGWSWGEDTCPAQERD